MKKIPTLFVRNPDDMRHVLDQVTPGCEWVLAGEGRPTRKFDGTCVMKDMDGNWYARREVKADKEPPPNFWPMGTDENTGKTVGWEPIEQSPFHKFWREAMVIDFGDSLEPGTYELCGPKINGNLEDFTYHAFVPHGESVLIEFAGVQSFERLRQQLTGDFEYEGIVWHHPDGRMAKIKRRDFV